MDMEEKIKEMEKELGLCRNKVKELEGVKRALPSHILNRMHQEFLLWKMAET